MQLLITCGDESYTLTKYGEDKDPGNYVFVTTDLQHLFPIVTLFDAGMEIYTEVEVQ